MRRTVIRGTAIASVLVIVLGVPASALQGGALQSSPQVAPPRGTVLDAQRSDAEADNELKPDKKPKHDKKLKPAHERGPDKDLKPDNKGSNGNCHGIQHAFGRVSTNHGAGQSNGNAVQALQAVADRRGCELSVAAAPD